MEVFDPTPPPWVEDTVHARGFCCPQCQAGPRQALRAWINRRSPVLGDDRRRKWLGIYSVNVVRVGGPGAVTVPFPPSSPLIFLWLPKPHLPRPSG
ncbi:hypothetical protein [Synechocystis salina]|uniref:hypothetical protein n=1 Tax=Synechocystis salina TaxID=945780 RepID=UPI002AD43341|nr:hypothetical protein [Synechocystis salina]